MFQIIKGYGAESENLAVKALDDKRLEVTLSSAVPYFTELLAFQTFFPVREDVVKNESWATDAKTYVSNGPYTMSSWEHNSQITITKNDAYPQSDEINMREIKFYLSDDANNMLANFKNGSWQLIDNIPTNEISALKSAYPEEFFTKGEIGTYYVSWNINFDLLPFEKEMSKNEKAVASAEIRRAINLIPDRNYIADSIGQAGHIPASSFVALGIKNPDGSEFSSTAGNNENYSGYFDVSKEAYKSNVFYALDVLKKYYSLDIPK